MWNYCLLGFTLVNLGLLVSAGYIDGGLGQISSQEFNELCPEGQFENEEGVCVGCTVCGEGEGEKRPCGHYHDRECEVCRRGYKYSVLMSDTRACFPCTRCHHKSVEQHCTPTSDAVCGQCMSGFFYDELTHSCLRCSFCDPDRPEQAVRLHECRAQPHNYQCYPLSSDFLTDNSEDFLGSELDADYRVVVEEEPAAAAAVADPFSLVDPVEFESSESSSIAAEMDSEQVEDLQSMADQAEKEYRDREEQIREMQELEIETDAFIAQSKMDAYTDDKKLIDAIRVELSNRQGNQRFLIIIVTSLLAISLLFSAFTLFYVIRLRKSMSRDAARRVSPIYRPFQAMIGGNSKVSSQLLSPEPDHLEFR